MGQVAVVIEGVLANYCVNMDQIWALGTSNGAIFSFELANDPRTGKYLKGITPQVGQPMWGFNKAPYQRMSMIGFWGLHDVIVPSLSLDGSDMASADPAATEWFSEWFI